MENLFMNPRMVKVPNFRDNQTPTYLDITRWIPGGDVFDVKHGSGVLPGIPAPFQPSFVRTDLLLIVIKALILIEDTADTWNGSRWMVGICR